MQPSIGNSARRHGRYNCSPKLTCLYIHYYTINQANFEISIRNHFPRIFPLTQRSIFSSCQVFGSEQFVLWDTKRMSVGMFSQINQSNDLHTKNRVVQCGSITGSLHSECTFFIKLPCLWTMDYVKEAKMSYPVAQRSVHPWPAHSAEEEESWERRILLLACHLKYEKQQ